MSHNVNKVNAQGANRAGEVSQALGDLSDVSSTSPTDGYYLQYDNSASEWQPKEVTTGSSSSAPHIWIGEGASQTYPEAWSGGNDVYFYSSSTPVNTISGASVGSSDTITSWYDEFTLPAGTYWAYARVDGDFASSNGQFQYIFKSTPTGGGGQVSHAASGWSASSANTGQNPHVAQSLFELSAEAVLVVNIANTNSLGTASTNQALYGFITIVKVG